MSQVNDYTSLDEKASAPQPHKKKLTPWYQRTAIALTGLLALSGVYHHVQKQNAEVSAFEAITVPETTAIRPESYLHDDSPLKFILKDPGFRSKAAGILSGSLQIETESYDDNPDPADDMTPWKKFFAFHSYLERQFPLVHKNLKVETVNHVNLLYTWEGSDPSLKPLMLTAHQDVVPVDKESAGEWTYPPYSGHYDGTTIWGRGAQDCKNLLIAELQAVEKLLETGFTPKRTVILAFGNDEESGGQGASYLNHTLTERYGEDSIYAVVDEGLPMVNVGGEWFALPGVSEKGHLDIYIALTMNGGHSSTPPDHTAIGVMGELITSLEANPFTPYLPNDSPVMQMLETFAATIPEWPESLKKDVANAKKDPAAKKRVLEWMATSKELKFLVQTSQAIDIIHGGVKANALPEYVTLLVNHRIILESTVDETVDRLFTIMNPIAKKYGLHVFYDEQEMTQQDLFVAEGYFNVSLEGAINALPIAPSSGPVWDLLTGTLKHVFEDEVFENQTLHFAPNILVGNTDTKRYTGLTKNLYRFQATRVIDANTGLHSIDEHIGIDQHLETMAFLYEYIQNVDATTD